MEVRTLSKGIMKARRRYRELLFYSCRIAVFYMWLYDSRIWQNRISDICKEKEFAEDTKSKQLIKVYYKVLRGEFMKNQFGIYPLSAEVLDALHILHYSEPTPIQTKVIPLALEAKNLIAQSKTGSGKTAAFAIPICEIVKWEYNEPQVLVLEPTRELTVQVKDEIYHIGRKKRLKVPDLFGGFPIDKQIQTLRQKSHIIVGTPGRVLDHIRRESLKLQRIQTVVIDEADLMFDMGFREDVESILQQIPNKYTMMLFSATIGDEIQSLVSTYMPDAVSVVIEDSQETEEQVDITQKTYQVPGEEKYRVFKNVFIQENPKNAMIFCGTKEMVNVLCRKMQKDHIKCGMIHGDIEQQDRIRTIESFREGRIRYLIATDVIARGIDFENLSYVINYDFPTGKETYVHRIGRTGRNGAKGTAISFITPEDIRMKEQVELYVGYTLPVYEEEPLRKQAEEDFWKRQKEKPVLKPKKGAGFAAEIMKLSIGGGKKSKIRTTDIVGAISNIDGITPQDIGAIDVRDSLSYVEILNGKGSIVLEALQTRPLKGKIRKVRKR